MNITQVQILHTLSYRHTHQKHSHYNNGTSLCIKTEKVKTKSSFSPALVFGGCNNTIYNNGKKKMMKPVKLNTDHPKKTSPLQHPERSLFGFQFDTFWTTCYQSAVAERLQLCSDLRSSSVLTMRPCRRFICVCFCFCCFDTSSFFIIRSRYIGHYQPTLAGTSLRVRRRVTIHT